MSWIKNVFNKLISDEPEYKEQTNNVHNEQEEIEYDEQPVADYSSEQMVQSEEQPTEKKAFNFPNYSDGKNRTTEVPQMAENSIVTAVENTDERPLRLRKGVEPKIDKNQYSPFASHQHVGRPVIDSGRANYRPFANSGVVPKKQKPVEFPKASNRKIPSFEELKRDVKEIVQVKQATEAPPKKPKFVPTDVPSPVYGFKKPVEKTAYDRKVNELLIEERQRHKGTIAEQLVQQRLEKEHRIANAVKGEAKQVIEPQATIQEPEPIEFRNERKTIVPKDIKTTDITVEKFSLDLSDVVREIEVPEPVETMTTEALEEPVEAPATEALEEVVIEAPEETMATEVPIEEVVIEAPEETMAIEAPIEEVVIEEPIKAMLTEALEEVVIEAPEETMIIESLVEEMPIEATQMDIVSSMDEEVSNNTLETNVVEKRISKTPINVVMLNSDKAKLKANEEVKQRHLNIAFPSWKKNPLKVMQSYGQINQPSEKATAHKAVEEVHPTAGNSQQFLEEDVLFASQTEAVDLYEEKIEEIFDVTEQKEIERVNSTLLEVEAPRIIQADILPERIEVTEEARPATWSSYYESLALLREPVEEQQDYEWMESQGELLKDVLTEFNIPAEIVQIFQGPTVTQFEITVGNGVKVSKIRNLSDNLKLALAAREIRIEAPIPGKRTIGIEIPNANARPVRLSEIVSNSSFEQSTNQLEVALGLDLTGKPVTFNLNEMPHGLIAGSTGSGKSVCINSILMSLIMKASPNDVKLMLIDPKMVELAVYDDLPHLVSPVITDVKAATAALKWAVEEMERRYQLFHHMKVRHINRYNEIVEEQRRFSLKMPYLVIVIDELADLMMMAPAEVEESICRIAQKARACGIHLVLATQRPSVDVITGLIKSNIPTRIAFAVSSQIDSRTILDKAGAERLLGKGDMLYLASGESDPTRLQGTFVTDEEIEDVTSFIRTLGKPNYAFAPEELVHKVEREEEQDDLFEEVCRHVAEEGSVSISALQRKYRIGYNRAARLVEMMDTQGFISESRGTKPRDVFLTPEKAEEIFS